jgi:hypothetical protein
VRACGTHICECGGNNTNWSEKESEDKPKAAGILVGSDRVPDEPADYPDDDQDRKDITHGSGPDIEE